MIGRCECEKVLHQKSYLDQFQGRAAGRARLQREREGELGHTGAASVHFGLKDSLYLAISVRWRVDEGEGGREGGRVIPLPQVRG